MNGDGQTNDNIGNVDGQNIFPANVTTGTLTATNANVTGTLTATNANLTNILADDVAGFTLEITELSQLGDVEADGNITATGLITAQDIDVTNNITMNGFSAVNGLFEEFRFIDGGQAPSIAAPFNYKFPTTSPPNDSNIYALCNQPSQSTITTPNTFPNFKLILTENLDTVTIVVTFIFNTTVDATFVYSRINDYIEKWFSLQNSPSYVSLSLDVSSFPYHTNVNVTSPTCSAQILVDGTTAMAPLLGYSVTSPVYGFGTTQSPLQNSFTLLAPNSGQLGWSDLNNVITSISDQVQNEIQSDDLATNVICQSNEVSINVDNNQRLLITDTGYTSLRSDSVDTRLDLDNGGSIFMSSMGSVVFYVLGASTRIFSPSNSSLLTLDTQGVKINDLYYLPTSDGTLNQYISTDGAGVTSWQTLPTPGIFSQTSVVTVANTATETNINGVGVGSLTIPANYFSEGTSIIYKSGGVFRDSSNGQTFRFRFKMGASTILDTGLLTLGNINTSRAWSMQAQMTYYTGNIITNFKINYNDGTSAHFGFCAQSSSAFNPAVSNILQCTVQWTTANANNTITSNYCTVTKLY